MPLAVELHAGVENDARMMNRRAASRSAAPRPSGGGVDLTRPRWPVLVAAVAIVLVWMALVFATYNAVVDSGLDQLRRQHFAFRWQVGRPEWLQQLDRHYRGQQPQHDCFLYVYRKR